jgi:hypothetical protein
MIFLVTVQVVSSYEEGDCMLLIVVLLVCGCVFFDCDVFAMKDFAAEEGLAVVTSTSIDTWLKQGKNCLNMACERYNYEHMIDAQSYFQKIVDYEGAAQEYPGALSEARYYLCVCLLTIGDDKKAEQALLTLMKQVSRNAMFYECAERQLGRLELLHKNYEKASAYIMNFMQHMSKAIKTKEPQMYNLALGDLAVAEWGMGDLEGLKALAFERLFDEHGNAASYLNDLAREYKFNTQLFSKTKNYLFCYRALAYFYLIHTAREAFAFMLKNKEK